MQKSGDEYPYGEEVELRASKLWRRENPNMSVFACDAEMKRAYRQRILDEISAERQDAPRQK